MWLGLRLSAPRVLVHRIGGDFGQAFQPQCFLLWNRSNSYSFTELLWGTDEVICIKLQPRLRWVRTLGEGRNPWRGAALCRPCCVSTVIITKMLDTACAPYLSPGLSRNVGRVKKWTMDSNNKLLYVDLYIRSWWIVLVNLYMCADI